jgi:hypothetical protein
MGLALRLALKGILFLEDSPARWVSIRKSSKLGQRRKG